VSDHPSTTYPVGTTTVTWTATDIHGNSSTTTATVVVTDNENPVIAAATGAATAAAFVAGAPIVGVVGAVAGVYFGWDWLSFRIKNGMRF
jgi:hypothetical protein